jgi:hypothetical protein
MTVLKLYCRRASPYLEAICIYNRNARVKASAVVPGRVEDADPESRDSGSTPRVSRNDDVACE